MNKDHDAILKRALEQFSDADSGDQENLEAALSDLEFATGIGQWDEADRIAREESGRPMLTINRMPQFIRQVTGDIRRTNPSVKITAGDNEATEEAAEIIEGLVRNIEQACDASSIYERAAESAAACGIGHWRIRSDYEDDDSFDQTIFIESIPNPFAVRWDFDAKDPTRKDARYCFIIDPMPLDKFKKEYPDADTDGWLDPTVTASTATWQSGDTVMVAEYFWIEKKPVTLYQLYDGTVTDKKPEMPDLMVARKRETTKNKVMWAKMTANEILDGPRELPGKFIPVVSVVGEETHVGDRTVRTSVIRYAKDAQRMYNYWRTTQTELVALQPKAPYMVTPGQIAGHEDTWRRANTANLPFLPYNPDQDAPGAPKRESPPMASQGMSQEVSLAAEDMKATTGIYDAGLGQQSNETSGVAIRQRQMEGDIATSIYVDNLSKSIAHCGRIIVDMIPEIFDTTRAVQIIGKDDEAQMVQLNVPYTDETGENLLGNNLSVGRYDVRISTGPNYSTQRQEAAESMTEFVRVFPQAAPLIGDLIAKNMDWPGAEQIADRLKAMLPPGVADGEEGQDPMVQQLQQQLQQLQEQLQGMAQQPEFRKAQAEAAEAEFDAQKAKYEADEKGLELAIKRGQIDEAIRNGIARGLAPQAPTSPMLGQQ
ncbi:portal protein [Sulfitobacter sp. 20_GPM-1509m]|uniref:portal protein n=1 Tax=Sulfitobacter sp. 20_GPM-1509m TaxID=1380367 RepID=UPI00048D42E9|nr:portal protein [Sulfitobacter sp. 20_GPM-1509m]